MRDLLANVDRLLRGGFTSSADLREGRIPVKARVLARLGLVLGMAYGVFMGLYAVLGPGDARYLQVLATSLKVPLLFLLTLVVTLPSLYVFSALARSRLHLHDTLRMLLIAVAVNLALLASFGPVTGFFTLSTSSYPFMVLLNVAFFAISGFVGLRFLSGALDEVFTPTAPQTPAAPEAPPAPAPRVEEGSLSESAPTDSAPGPASRPPSPAAPATPTARALQDAAVIRRLRSRHTSARRIFVIWTFIYGVVGAQMGWILRPFVGSPTRPFEWFRTRESHFFEAVLDTISRLFE